MLTFALAACWTGPYEAEVSSVVVELDDTVAGGPTWTALRVVNCTRFVAEDEVEPWQELRDSGTARVTVDAVPDPGGAPLDLTVLWYPQSAGWPAGVPVEAGLASAAGAETLVVEHEVPYVGGEVSQAGVLPSECPPSATDTLLLAPVLVWSLDSAAGWQANVTVEIELVREYPARLYEVESTDLVAVVTPTTATEAGWW